VIALNNMQAKLCLNLEPQTGTRLDRAPVWVLNTTYKLRLIGSIHQTTYGQVLSLNEWMKVAQLKFPFAGMYSPVNTIWQPSTGSTLMVL
jgi:hypothetical protein